MSEIAVNLIEYSRVMVRAIDAQTIADLKDSIRQYGVLQPIVVFRNSEDKWEVICGNHRLCAARGVGLKTIPVVIRQCDRSEALLLSLTENIQRFEMDPIREGELYHNMVGNFFDVDFIAKKICKSKAYVETRLRIFRNLHPTLKAELGKTLNLTNASALSKLGQNEQLTVFAKMKAASFIPQSQEDTRYGYGGYGMNGIPSLYCLCEKCGSKHLKGVSVGDERRAEKILSNLIR